MKSTTNINAIAIQDGNNNSGILLIDEGTTTGLICCGWAEMEGQHVTFPRSWANQQRRLDNVAALRLARRYVARYQRTGFFTVTLEARK